MHLNSDARGMSLSMQLDLLRKQPLGNTRKQKCKKKCGKEVLLFCDIVQVLLFLKFYIRHSIAELLTVHNKYDLIRINMNNILIKLEVSM